MGRWADIPVAAGGLFQRDSIRRIRDWVDGDSGREEIARLLTKLESEGYEVLRDVRVRTGTVPYVVVGPTGVLTVEIRSWWPLDLTIRQRLMKDRWETDPQTQDARRASMELREPLRAVSIDDCVETLLVLTRAM
ncbi:MAG: NERD domain-containing protein, partial [Actinomycetota bacterium]|nr:NERD domain-containing protein [Actinomycetota bacterium]